MDTDDRIRQAMREKMKDMAVTSSELARRLGIKAQSVGPLLKAERGKIPESLLRALNALDLELVVQPKAHE